jgi:hypothetical protein
MKNTGSDVWVTIFFDDGLVSSIAHEEERRHSDMGVPDHADQ